jgi:phospholipid-binding lipoprotein MlaA
MRTATRKPWPRRHAPLVFAAMLAGGCASAGGNPDDPLESYNRAMFTFNDKLDRTLIKPVAQGYQAVLPSPVRTGVGNFFGNLGDPWIAVNSLLQGKATEAFNGSMRFVFNSTLGLLGLIDIATPMGLPKHDEDLGQTFGAWGVGEGAYVVLPFFGPRTVRDTFGLAGDIAADPVQGIDEARTANSLTAVRVVDDRARLLGTEKTLEEGTLDPYAYARDFYLEQRRYKVSDGATSRVYEDFDEEPNDAGGEPAAPASN